MSRAGAVERLRACGRAALMVLAALLPFEKLEPLARLGPLQLSSVELFLYLALAVWGATLVAGGTNVFTARVDAEELCRLSEQVSSYESRTAVDRPLGATMACHEATSTFLTPIRRLEMVPA